MMKKLILLGTGALLAFSSFGQDAKSKEILDKLTEKTKAYKSIKAEFSYKIHNAAEGVNETQTGTLITKGDKYFISIADQEIMSDGKMVWTYLKKSKECQESAIDSEESDMMNPKKLFTMYESGFKAKYVKQLTKNGKTYELINIYPDKPGEKSYHTVRLSILAKEMRINKVMIKGKDGTNYTYSIKTFSPNVEVNDEVFTFDKTKHPDVEVINLDE